MTRAWRNVKKMIEDRHYIVTYHDSSIIRADREGCSLVAFCLDETKLNVKKMRSMVNDYANCVIVVLVELGMTAFTRKELSALGVDVQVFTHSDMVVCGATHSLMPDHELITCKTAIEDLMRRLNTTHAEFPRLLTTDIFTRYYGLAVGDVVMFQRSFGYNASSKFYRMVCTS